jgi:hypothetical protein
MAKLKQTDKTLTIEIDTTNLDASQIRLIKSMSILIPQVLKTASEQEFFDGSAEFMRLCASIIKQTKFSESQKKLSDIPYANQALEYSIDILEEHMQKASVVTYDN